MQRRQNQNCCEASNKLEKSFNLNYCKQLIAKRDWEQLNSKAQKDLTEFQVKHLLKKILRIIKVKQQQSYQFFKTLAELNQNNGFQPIKFQRYQPICGSKVQKYFQYIMEKSNQEAGKSVAAKKELQIALDIICTQRYDFDFRNLSSLDQKSINKLNQIVQKILNKKREFSSNQQPEKTEKNLSQSTFSYQNQIQIKLWKQIDRKVKQLLQQIGKIKTKKLKIKLNDVTSQNFHENIPKLIGQAEQKYVKLDQKYRKISLPNRKQGAQDKDSISLDQSSEMILLRTPSKGAKIESKLYTPEKREFVNQSTSNVFKINSQRIQSLQQQINRLNSLVQQILQQKKILNQQISKLKHQNYSHRNVQQNEKFTNNFIQGFQTPKVDYTIDLKESFFITALLQNSYGKQIKATQHIYRFKPDFIKANLKLNNPHIYFDGRKNLLFIFRLSTNKIIGGFIHEPIQKGGFTQQQQKKEAFLFNAASQSKFPLKPQKRQKSYIYQLNFIILGSSDIRVPVNQTKIQSFFGKSMSSFKCGDKGTAQLITKEELENPLKQYNIYQIEFDGDQLNNNPNQASFQKEFLQISKSLHPPRNFQNSFSANFDDISQLAETDNQSGKLKKQDLISKNKHLDSEISQKNQFSFTKKYKQQETQQTSISVLKSPINKFYNLKIQRNINVSIQPKQTVECAISAIYFQPQNQPKQMQKKQIDKPLILMKNQSIIVDFMEQQEKQDQERRRLQQSLQKVKTLHLMIENLQQANKSLRKQVQKSKQQIKVQKRNYELYFSSSNLFYNKYHKQKQYIVDILQSHYRSSMTYTKLIYRYDIISKVNFHEYIDNVAQLLVIVKTRSGKIIGGYTHQGFRPNEVGYKGFIFSATDETDFQINPKSKKIASIYDPYYIIFGNCELRIKTQDKVVFSNFGIVNNYFLTNGHNVDILIGEGKNVRETPIETFEIYQVIFSQFPT